MVSSYTPNKRIEKPANGDYNNTWSTPVNSDWDIIDRAFGGTTTLNAVAASGTVALTVNQYQAPIVAITGALTANVNYQLPAGVGGFWFVFNNTSGSFSILFSSAGGGSTVTLAQGKTTAVICDGTNVGLADTSVPSAAGSTTQVQYNLSGQLAGSSGFVFDGSGNVGIGTASPGARLDVAGGNVRIANNQNIQFRNAAGTGFAAILLQSDDNFVASNAAGTPIFSFTQAANPLAIYGGNANNRMTFDTGINAVFWATNGSERMRIDSAGNVGIGTSSPSTYGKFAIAGTGTVISSVVGDATGEGQIVYNNVTAGRISVAGAFPLIFQTNSNERFRITSTGAITSSDLPNAVGYKGIPQSTNTTAAVGDIGKHIYVSTSVTINASVFSAGDSFVIVNSNTATTSINIVAGAGVTLRLAGTTTSGTPRPILPNGMASVLCVVGGASPVFLISGAGVT